MFNALITLTDSINIIYKPLNGFITGLTYFITNLNSWLQCFREQSLVAFSRLFYIQFHFLSFQPIKCSLLPLIVFSKTFPPSFCITPFSFLHILCTSPLSCNFPIALFYLFRITLSFFHFLTFLLTSSSS